MNAMQMHLKLYPNESLKLKGGWVKIKIKNQSHFRLFRQTKSWKRGIKIISLNSRQNNEIDKFVFRRMAHTKKTNITKAGCVAWTKFRSSRLHCEPPERQCETKHWYLLKKICFLLFSSLSRSLVLFHSVEKAHNKGSLKFMRKATCSKATHSMRWILSKTDFWWKTFAEESENNKVISGDGSHRQWHPVSE